MEALSAVYHEALLRCVKELLSLSNSYEVILTEWFLLESRIPRSRVGYILCNFDKHPRSPDE